MIMNELMDKQEMITGLVEDAIQEHIDDSDNYTRENTLKRVNEYQIKQYVKTALKYEGLTHEEGNSYYKTLCSSFKLLGIYGKGNRYDSESLNILRDNLKVSLSSVLDNKDTLFVNNTYFFTCVNGSLVMVEGLIIKNATIGHMFTDTNRPNEKLTIETLKEIKSMTDKPINTGEQQTTSK